MNAAAVHLHEHKQHENQQQAQPEEEHEQSRTGVESESDGDYQLTGACAFTATAAVAFESEANDTAEDASDSEPEYQEKPVEAAVEGRHVESPRTGLLDRAATDVLPEPKATEIDSTVSEPVADEEQVADRPAKSLEPKAGEVVSKESEPESAVESLATSELASAMHDLQQGLGAGFASFQAAFSVSEQIATHGHFGQNLIESAATC
jgi:hypothetical protein